MSGMEPEIRDFLKTVLKTISAGMLFLIFHMTVGLYFNWAFYQENIRIGNIIYYFILAGSFFYILFYLYNIWKDKLLK
jgi:NADH:ubiquinone oxidoreductase subunit 3 (subunit A)